MAYSIFYSWQSDTPKSVNRDFIRGAIDAVVSQLSADVSVNDAPRIESGMDGVSGTPEVASVMFKRIRKSAVFIADVTLVGTIKHSDGREDKHVPNPNVLLEMGYAAARIGWGRIICVMNEQYGERADQPFDVRNRRFPIDYKLKPEDANNCDAKRNDLTQWIKTAIESVLENEYEAVSDAIEALDITCHNFMQLYGTADYLPSPDDNKKSFGRFIDSSRINSTIARLLDLRILKADYDSQQSLYAYHWTYLGREVLKRLKLRPDAIGNEPDVSKLGGEP